MTRYLKLATISLLTFLVLVALFNLLVDPYRLWTVSGGLAPEFARPRALQQVTLVKSRGISRERPITIILGNSRAEIGFDPHSNAWPASFKPAYNAAIPGGGPATTLTMLEQAIDTGGVKHAVIGLDFLDFLTAPDEPLEALETLEHTRARQKTASIGMVDLRLVMALDTFLDAATTVAKIRDPFSPNIDNSGFNPAREYIRYSSQEGYGSLFKQKDTENARTYAKAPKGIHARDSVTSASWQALHRLVSVAGAHGIDARFVIYPYHAHILEMFQHAGLLSAFEAWKRQLVTAVGANAGDLPCRLWDFSGYSAYAMERVPAFGDKRTPMSWYWESGHFKRELGDRMLDRMFGVGREDFGECLTGSSVDRVIARFARGHVEYVDERREEAEAVGRLFRPAAP